MRFKLSVTHSFVLHNISKLLTSASCSIRVRVQFENTKFAMWLDNSSDIGGMWVALDMLIDCIQYFFCGRIIIITLRIGSMGGARGHVLRCTSSFLAHRSRAFFCRAFRFATSSFGAMSTCFACNVFWLAYILLASRVTTRFCRVCASLFTWRQTPPSGVRQVAKTAL